MRKSDTKRFLTHAAVIAAVFLAAPAAGQSAGGISVKFKLDPRLTQSLYMGERWVSPSTYTINHPGTTATVYARARAVDARGQRSPVDWTPHNPEMVAVATVKGDEVKISVLRPGESTLQVGHGAAAKKFSVKATYKNGAMLVQISQESAAPRAVRQQGGSS